MHFSKPYHILPPAAVLLIMLSVVPFRHSMNVGVQGASYVLNYVDTLRSFAMLLLLLWILYMFTIRILFSTALIWIHIVLTLLLLLSIVLLFFYFSGQHHPASVGEVSFQSGFSPQMIIPVLIWILLIVQLSYILNLLMGVVRRLN